MEVTMWMEWVLQCKLLSDETWRSTLKENSWVTKVSQKDVVLALI